MKLVAAAIQMPSEPRGVAANRDRADALLHEAHRAGAALAWGDRESSARNAQGNDLMRAGRRRPTIATAPEGGWEERG